MIDLRGEPQKLTPVEEAEKLLKTSELEDGDKLRITDHSTEGFVASDGGIPGSAIEASAASVNPELLHNQSKTGALHSFEKSAHISTTGVEKLSDKPIDFTEAKKRIQIQFEKGSKSWDGSDKALRSNVLTLVGAGMQAVYSGSSSDLGEMTAADVVSNIAAEPIDAGQVVSEAENKTDIADIATSESEATHTESSESQDAPLQHQAEVDADAPKPLTEVSNLMKTARQQITGAVQGLDTQTGSIAQAPEVAAFAPGLSQSVELPKSQTADVGNLSAGQNAEQPAESSQSATATNPPISLDAKRAEKAAEGPNSEVREQIKPQVKMSFLRSFFGSILSPQTEKSEPPTVLPTSVGSQQEEFENAA